MNKRFIKATEAFCSVENHIPAPLIRKSFDISDNIIEGRVSVCGLGFYRLFVNGKDITKGHIAPYISNPDHYCYYDEYEITSLLNKGENVIGIILGNGFINAFGGAPWDFDKAPYRSAPKLALELDIKTDKESISICADESFLTHPSATLFDDLRLGEIYDAREEICGWNLPGFDASLWTPAIVAEAPKGELKPCQAEPIVVNRKISPISITKQGDGYLYDFGINTAGVCRLCIKGKPGQKITMWHGEVLKDGEFTNENIRFSLDRFPYYEDYNQTVRYTCRGEGEESYTPDFSYYGFRYVLVEGITEEQATEKLLTYHVMSSDLRKIGGFRCSDERANKLFEMMCNADRSNFFYFPTDCPHREKNGWTADASMSVDHMILTLDVSRSLQIWLENIRKAQRDDGAIPGIIPTADWGFGQGPLWDSVIFNLPYELYKRRGELAPIEDNADMMLKYLRFILGYRCDDGTVDKGLGDWCQVGLENPWGHDCPVKVSSSIALMDMAKKAEEMLRAIGREAEAEYAFGIYSEMREVIRRELVDFETMTVSGACQTSQSAALYYGVFEEEEREAAFLRLLDFIKEKNNKIASGVLGLHCIFSVLSDFGRSNLAYEMIMADEYPSYAELIKNGETAMVEKFMPEYSADVSHNHHFLGDVSRWFINNVAGLNVVDSTTVKIKPLSVTGIDFAEAFYELPQGRVEVRQARDEKGKLKITVTAPDGVEIIRD